MELAFKYNYNHRVNYSIYIEQDIDGEIQLRSAYHEPMVTINSLDELIRFAEILKNNAL